MRIIFNGKDIKFDGERLSELTDKDVKIVNGYMVSHDVMLKDGDIITAIDKGVMPSYEELQYMLSARNTPFVNDKLKDAVVGIAGLGGIGSHIAVALARLGVGRLVVADYDVVEPSNLNRQYYSVGYLGKKKAYAIKDIILSINPYTEVTAYDVKIGEDNACKIFADCTIVAEAFDNPDSKAMLVNTLLSMTDKKVVACSGMAGYGSGNEIKIRRAMKNLYIAGDNISEAEEYNGLMSPRVMICAGQQANMILRLLIGIEEV